MKYDKYMDKECILELKPRIYKLPCTNRKLKQFIHNPRIIFPEEVIEMELDRLRDSKFETAFTISHDGDEDKLSLSEDNLKALCNNIMEKLKIPEGERIVAIFEDNDHNDIVGWAVYDEDGPITDIIQTGDLENWRDHIMFNVKGTYSSVEHGKDGTVTLHDINIEGIDL